MKKNILLAAGAVLVAAAVSVFVYVKNENNSMDELFNANVEALANNEEGISGTCCPDENFSCVLSWVTIPGHFLKGDIGPCSK
jgi:hypothetical protein